jgi:hypothetical protein
MFNAKLNQAVHDFASLLLPLTERDLERSWAWKDHHEEGIRFSFFVSLQELRQLAVTLAALRPKRTPVQHILSQYHAAYADLQAALLGLPAEESDRAPADGEWSVRRTYAHILGAEINFSLAIRYALERHRAGTWSPEPFADQDADRLAGISDEEYLALTRGPLERMQAYHRQFHPALIEEFCGIGEEELDLPSTFWEETRFPIRHRLHRYEAHFVQHTVQIDKTRIAIGQAPSEVQRLLRKVFAALAEAEGLMIGAEKMDEAAILATASSISHRTAEIRSLL